MAEQQISSRQSTLFMVDCAAFICGVGSIVTGVVLWLFVGKGPGPASYLWGWHRHELGDLHLCFSLGLMALLGIHFVQHWRWIRAIAPRQAWRAAGIWGALRIALVSAVTIAAVLLAFYALRGDPASYGQHGEGKGGGRGQGGGGKGWRAAGAAVTDTVSDRPAPASSDPRATETLGRHGRVDATQLGAAEAAEPDTAGDGEVRPKRRGQRWQAPAE